MASPKLPGSRARAAALATRFRHEAAAVCAVVEAIGADHWQLVPSPGVWSIGKEAEHVGDALGYHTWIVCLTIGEKVAPRRPSLERADDDRPVACGGRRSDPPRC